MHKSIAFCQARNIFITICRVVKQLKDNQRHGQSRKYTRPGLLGQLCEQKLKTRDPGRNLVLWTRAQVGKKLEFRNYSKGESTLMQSLKDWNLEWRRLRLVIWVLPTSSLDCSGNWGRAESLRQSVWEPRWAEADPVHSLGFNLLL